MIVYVLAQLCMCFTFHITKWTPSEWWFYHANPFIHQIQTLTPPLRATEKRNSRLIYYISLSWCFTGEEIKQNIHTKYNTKIYGLLFNWYATDKSNLLIYIYIYTSAKEKLCIRVSNDRDRVIKLIWNSIISNIFNGSFFPPWQFFILTSYIKSLLTVD